ncbi:uncharacterized protein LOC135112272 [Scylla paramamosain]|uniref:uncharacterized protein LOC135112272 n=1 Tax=Scylla paramamosain TaxID=85552 RepID=UPI003082F949
MDKVVKECMVCQTTWDNKRHQPVALPACGHSFCRHCLIKLRNVKEVVECPICRKVLVDLLPEDLPVNWALLQSVDPSPNMEFEEWARASGLTDSTIKKLVSEDLNSRVALKLLNGNDIFELGLTIGQRKILMAIVEELQEPETRKDTQKAPSDGKKQQSSDNNMPLKKEDPEGEDPKSDKKNDVAKKIIIGTAVGGLVGVGAVVAAPFALAAAGFTSAGIAAGSLAASMMSSAAIANGGAIAAGSTVAVLQSIGAVGIPLAANVAIAGGATAAGLGVGAGAAALGARNKKDTGSEKKNEDNDNEDKPNVKIDKPL